MKRIIAALAAVTIATVGFAIAGDEPTDHPQTQPANPAAFLERLTGKWTATSYAVMDPDQEPYRFEGKESARMLGRQWLVSEFLSEVEGVTINAILTVGYDPVIEKFVATYVSSMQSTLWSYTGTLDEEGNTLTLNTKGPFMGDPDQPADFRVLIRLKDADQWSMHSQILMPDDGEWFEFLRLEYQREEAKPGT
ncbi:MAG: DUF1579 domain-containing protein [Phycisphaerales bacterium]|nr:DUF1579 domain-containing protein [Planctomycetota bacterium]MCH8508959.1 DUF1579 domain-containing protein [Phycisphaerales bacterium]